MSKLQDERILKKILFLFMFLQPVLDCYLLYTDSVIKIFKFSPTTIIRMILIVALFVLVFFNKENKPNRKAIYIYGGLTVLYIIFHNLNAININNENFSTFSFGFVTEIFYMIRMLLPMAMIFIVYSLKPTKHEVIKLFLSVALLIGIISVGSNLLIIARASYGKSFIKGNIFDWFLSNKYGSHELASKGWFNSANQIGGLTFVLLPICIYSVFEKINWKRIVITLLLVLSMIMLGTRVASYGWALIIVMMLILYLGFCFIFKNVKFEIKKILVVVCILIFGSLILWKAPIVNTNLSHNEKTPEELKKMKDDNVSVREMLKYIGMNEIYYVDIYPYEEHKEFWKYVVDEVSPEDRVGNRNSQRLITLDVGDTYKGFSSSVLGIGYSRFINAELYLEMDFVVHYFTIGILGIILFLLPYAAIAIWCFIKMIKNRKINLFEFTMLSVLVLPLLVSVLSGHIIDELIVTLYLGFVAGFLICFVEGEKNEKS